MNSKGTTVERTIQTESVAFAVVSAVADAIDIEPTEVEPLYRTIDPDALDQLFRETATGLGRFDGRVRFTMEGCEVVVRGDGKVAVTPPEASEGDDRSGRLE